MRVRSRMRCSKGDAHSALSAQHSALPLAANLRTLRGDGDRVLDLGGDFAVAGDAGPAVAQFAPLVSPLVDHRLDREDHAGAQAQSGAGLTDVLHRRLAFMQAPPDPVPAEAAHDAV